MLDPNEIRELNIEDLPDEVLEYILSLIPPYKDIHECMQVSKRWRRCVLDVVKTKKRNLHRAIADFDVKWHLMKSQESPPGITKRYSHSAVIYDDSMYVFGGCACSMTTFNDLWKLDLSTRQWIRPISTGMYPSPKACSSLVRYKETLVLFGGWTYPPSYPLYQTWHLFNELHVYYVLKNSWASIPPLANSPPPMAGHSVSIIRDCMVVFGGLHKPEGFVHCEKSNDVWVLDFAWWTWEKKTFKDGLKPAGRVGQTQVVLDDSNILIMGGSGGPTFSYSDVWVMHMGDVWEWRKLELRGEKYKPSNIWSNPGCKIGDKIVVLNKIREVETPSVVYYPKNTWLRTEPVEDGKSARIDLANRAQDIDENVNGRRGVLRNQRRRVDESSSSSSSSSNSNFPTNHIRNACACGNCYPPNDDPLPPMEPPLHLSLAAFSTRGDNSPQARARADMMRQRMLVAYDRVNTDHKKPPCKKEIKRQYMGIYVLDISHALDEEEPYVTWLPPKNCESGAEETVLYSLVEGKSELIMFGGIQQEVGALKMSTNINNQISNSVYFIGAPNYVI